MKKVIWIVLGSGALMLSGCQMVPYQGQARNVRLKPHKGGVISIPVNYRPEDHVKAEQEMAHNCSPYKPVVLEEGEAVVGEKTSSSTRETKRDSTEHKIGSLFGMPLVSGDKGGKDQSTSSVTTQVKEWHISYRCDHRKRTL